MGRNVEIKARAADFPGQARRAADRSNNKPEVIHQEDTFFFCREGRLKLRKHSPQQGELIFYERDDAAGPKECRYHRFPTREPDTLREALRRALGTLGVVRKKRTLYHVGQTRIHFDEVEGLGNFIELEVVLEPDQDPSEGEAIARGLMKTLQIRDADLVEQAYIDLLRG